jgi:DNA-directed RNA polymerase subunit RPC12/RpoP
MTNQNEEKLYKLLLAGAPLGELYPVLMGLQQLLAFSFSEAKRAVDAAPCEIIAGLTLEEAERLAAEMAQNSAMTEIVPDETSTEHNGELREVVCPECGFPNLKLIHYWPEGLLEYLPRDFGRRRHVCQACRHRFTTESRPDGKNETEGDTP